MEKAFTSARLVYRALEHDSAEDDKLLMTIARDVSGYANSNSSMLKTQNKKAVGRWKESVLNDKMFTVVVCLPAAAGAAEPGAPIGLVSLDKLTPNNTHHRNADISIDIVPDQQGKAYGSEAIRWMLNWGFQIAGLYRIGIEAFSYNEGAGRLYERLGFELEGRRKEFIWFNGAWHDLLCFVMLEDAWRAKEGLKAR